MSVVNKQIADMLDRIEAEQAQASKKRSQALEDLLAEVNTALGDLVDGLDERNKQIARGIADALKGVVLKVMSEAPQVKVEPRIEVRVPEAKPAQVTLQRGRVHLVGRVLSRDTMGRMETFEIKSKE